MGFILYLVALVLRPVILFLGMLWGLIKCFYHSHFNKGLKQADDKFYTMAASIDKYGSVVCKELFDDILITKESEYKFGRIQYTISTILGLNEREGTLTKFGKFIVKILDAIEKDHCKNSIPKINLE